MRRQSVVLVLAIAMCLGVGGAGAATDMNAFIGLMRQAHKNGITDQSGHSARYLVAAKLARSIRRFCRQGAGACALRGQAWTIEDVGWRTGVHPAFMIAASMTESSGGDAACAGNRYNIWGLGSCGRYWHVPTFVNWRQAFSYYARFLRQRWPLARTAWDLAGYCECGSTAWGNRTSAWMSRLGFGGGRLSYP